LYSTRSSAKSWELAQSALRRIRCLRPEVGLEVLRRFVLHAAVLDRCSVVVSAILTGDIARKVERASGLELISKPSLNPYPEVLEPHDPVNSIL